MLISNWEGVVCLRVLRCNLVVLVELRVSGAWGGDMEGGHYNNSLLLQTLMHI